jgi:hypothetical protein
MNDRSCRLRAGSGRGPNAAVHAQSLSSASGNTSLIVCDFDQIFQFFDLKIKRSRRMSDSGHFRSKTARSMQGDEKSHPQSKLQ